MGPPGSVGAAATPGAPGPASPLQITEAYCYGGTSSAAASFPAEVPGNVSGTLRSSVVPIGDLLPLTKTVCGLDGGNTLWTQQWLLPKAGGTTALVTFTVTLLSAGGEQVALVLNGVTRAQVPSPGFLYTFGAPQQGRFCTISATCPVDLHALPQGSDVLFGLLNIGACPIQLVANCPSGSAVKFGGTILTD